MSEEGFGQQFLDLDRPWRISMSEGEEVELFEVRRPVRLGKEALDKLVGLLKDRGNSNYAAVEALEGVTSPEGEDYSGYAVFLLVLKLLDDAAAKFGDAHTYLFGIAEDGGLMLLASSSWDSSEEQFLGSMDVALGNPSAVEMAVVALPVRRGEGSA